MAILAVLSVSCVKESPLSGEADKINLGTNDLNSSNEGFVVGSTSMAVAKVADVLDFSTGNVSGEVDATFAAGAIPTGETFPVNNYEYLEMNYLLVGKDQTTVDCAFGIYKEGSETATNTINVANVPVKRNFRTNIYGSLITDPADLEIEVKPGMGDLDNIEVTEVPATTPDEEFYQILQQGNSIVLSGDKGRSEINFNGLNIATDLTLTLEAPVEKVILGGNNENTSASSVDTKAGSAKPNITIVVAKDIKFPKFTFNGTTENYTIKGNLSTSQPLTEVIETKGHVKSFTVENVKATGNAKLYLSGTNLKVAGCVAENVNTTFIDLISFNGAEVLNNTISMNPSFTNEAADERHGMIFRWMNEGSLLVKDNTVNNARKHGFFYEKTNEGKHNLPITFEGNTVNGAVEDGIKTDWMTNVTVRDNAINVDEFGIRIDRITAGAATYVITGNTINTKCNNDSYGIMVRNRNEVTVNVNLTVNENTAGEDLLAAGRFFGTTGNGMTLAGDYAYPFKGLVKGALNVYATLDAAIEGGETELYLAEGTFDLSNTKIQGKNLKITGESTATIINAKEMYVQFPATNSIEISNVTIRTDNTKDHEGIEATTAKFTDCVFETNYYCRNTDATFENCIFKQDADRYNVWTYSSNVDFRNCEFHCVGKAALVYGKDSSKSYKVNFQDCEFYASAKVDGKAAIEIDSSKGAFDITIENCTSEGFAEGSNSGNTLYNLKNGTLGVNCIITVDGLQYISDGFVYDVENKVYNISNANGLKYFAANPAKNMTVKLTNDIDLAGGNWTPINSWDGVYNGLVLDGAGYSIKNMSIQYNDADSAYGFFASNSSSMTIKNLTFDKAVVNDKSGKSTRYAGVVMGKNYSNVTIENVHVTNSAVINNWQCGGLVGFAEGNAPVFVNCSISDSFVGGYNATAGAFFGLGRVAVTCTKCVATNVDLYTDMPAGLVGSLYGNTLTATDCEMTNVNVVSEYPAGL